eukprot:12918567-Prorocentrum_lima.AAC.1
MGTCWANSPRLNTKLIPFWIPATIPTNPASHDDSAVRLCFTNRHAIRLGPCYSVTYSRLLPPPGANEAAVTM